MDISEPYELEESLHNISEKDLSMINKSNPDDRIVEQPRIIKPPKPGIKLPKGLNYHSLDSGINDNSYKGIRNQENIMENQGKMRRTDYDKFSSNSPIRPRRPPLGNSSSKLYSTGSKGSPSFLKNEIVNKMGSDELLKRGSSVNSRRSKEEEERAYRGFLSSATTFKQNPLYKKMAEKIRNQEED